MTTLNERTRAFLRQRDAKEDAKIAREIGVHLYSLNCYRHGRTKSPSVDFIQRLYEHLSGEKLFEDKQ